MRRFAQRSPSISALAQNVHLAQIFRAKSDPAERCKALQKSG
jgi:hypothetical protein